MLCSHLKHIINASLALCSVILATQSMAASDSDRFSDIQLHTKPGDSILMFPLGYDFTAVQPETERILEALIARFSKLSLNVIRPHLEGQDFNAIQYLVNTEYEQEKKEEVRAALIGLYKKDNPSALVIFPSVISRAAKAKARQGKWDGVTHSLVMAGRLGHRGMWSGNLPALSLKLDYYTVDGKWIFTTYTGLILPYELHVEAGEHILKQPLYKESQDIDYLQKAVKSAVKTFKKRYYKKK